MKRRDFLKKGTAGVALPIISSATLGAASNNKSNINCDGELYLNKCEIEDLNDIKIDDHDFIKIIRKIK